MATVASPYGLYVRKCAGARRNTAGNTHYPVNTGVAGALYYGAPCMFAAGGGVTPVTATPSSALQVAGIVQGAQWISATRPEWFPSLPAGSASTGKSEVMVNDDPSLVMMIQANAAITAPLTKIGFVAGIVNFAAGNNSTGRSIAALDVASIAATGDKALRIIGYVLDPLDPYPDVLVQWNANVHSLQAATAGELGDPKGIDPEEQQIIFEEFVWERLNSIREEQGLPLLPTAEERQKAEEEKLEQLKKKQDESHKRVEQRLAERKATLRKNTGKVSDAEKREERSERGYKTPEPVVTTRKKE